MNTRLDNADRHTDGFWPGRLRGLQSAGLLLLLLAGSAGADTVYWTGSNSTAWATAGNWTNSAGATGAPTSADDVTINVVYGGATTNHPAINLSSTVTILSLTIGSTTASTLTFTNGNVNLATSKLRVDGNVTIGANGTLTHLPETQTTTGVLGDEKQRLFLDVGGDLTVNGAIDTSLKGYQIRPANAGGYGYAYGNNNNSAGHAGTAYGMNNDVYGSVTNPIYSGSANNTGGGGGIVKLVVAGTLTVNSSASILAEGAGGYNGSAGGSVNITAGALAGSGTVSAKARNATSGNQSGGGGRVAIILTNAPDTAINPLTLSANGGSSLTAANGGGAGTIYVKGTNTPNGRLIVDNAGYSSTTTYRTRINSNTGDLIVDDVVLRNQGRLEFTGGKQAIVYGSWSNGVAADAFGTPPVTLAGGATSTVWGANNWQSLTITNAGKTVTFQSGVTQTINAGGSLTLAGDSVNALTLNSTSPGTKWNVKATPTSVVTVNYVNATDSDASTGDPIKAPNSTITTCINWFAAPDAVTWNSGATTRNWGTAGNWDKSHVPLDWDNVTVVSAGNSPTLDVSRAVGSLTVATGGNVGLSNKNLTISGNMTVTGTVVAAGSEVLAVGSNLTFATAGVFTPAQSTLRLGGTGPQTVMLGGRTFYGLHVANTNAVTVTDTFSTRDLTFTNTSINVSFQDNFTATNVQAFVSGASTLTFGSGKTYTAYTLSLVGAAANKLVLTNSASGAWLLHVTGFGGAGNVAVNGSDASGYATIYAANSDDNGGNSNWDFGGGISNKVWVGTTTPWTTAGNWSPSGEPATTNNVLVLGGAAAQPTVPLSGGKTIQSLTILGASTLTFDSGDVSSKKLRVNGDVFIGANATLTHTPETATGTGGSAQSENHRLFLDVGGDLTIAAGGQIYVSACGYGGAAGNNPGYGPGGSLGDGQAASHGGENGVQSSGSASAPTYGSVTYPERSGSGTGYNIRGGGAARLAIGRALNLYGSVLADGSMGFWMNGSGGSLNIVAGTLAGNGTVSANGGTAGAGQMSGGGGGRVAIVLTNADDSAFSALSAIRAYGGLGVATDYRCGAAGTVYLKGTNTLYGRLIVDNNNISSTTTKRTLINSTVGDLTVGDVILRNQGRLSYDSTARKVTAYGSWSNGVSGAADSAAATVTLAGGLPATVWGDNNWYSLTITNAGKAVKFQAAKTQTINASGTVLFDNGVTLNSTTDGQWWYLTKGTPGSTQNVGKVYVRDSNASNGWTFVASGGANMGNNLNWKFPASGTVFMFR